MAKKKKIKTDSPAPKKAAVNVVVKLKYQNSIKRPEANSAAGSVWKYADQLSEKLGHWAPEDEICETIGDGNPAQIKRQVSRWKRFHMNEKFPYPTGKVDDVETK